MPDAENALRPLSTNAQGDDHCFSGIIDSVDHDRGEVLGDEFPLGQRLDVGRRGSYESSTDTRPSHAETFAGCIDDLLIIAGAHTADHAAKRCLRHGIVGLEAGIGLKWHFAAAISVPHARAFDGQLLAGKRRYAPLVAVSGVLPTGLSLVSLAAQPGDLVLENGGGNEHTKLNGQTVQGSLHDCEQFLPIQGELDFLAG